jgi:hypothetical protein
MLAMTRKAFFKDYTFSLRPKSGYGTRFRAQQGGNPSGSSWAHIVGVVQTPKATVLVEAWRDGALEVSSLEAVFEGKITRRRFDRFISQKGLTTKAKQFVAELYGD